MGYGCSKVTRYESLYDEEERCERFPDIKYNISGDDKTYYACSLHKEEASNQADQVVAVQRD